MNVRCVGRSTVGEPTPGNRTITKTPCGWKGERYGYFNGRTWENVNLTKPCPRCGSPIQLIGEVER